MFFYLLNHRLLNLSIAVWLPWPGQCFPPGKPAAQQKSHSYFTRWSDQNQESLNFIEKNLDLPLYKIEISGIIIIVRCASVAQLVEQGTENPRVIGSIPIGGTSQGNPSGFPICGRSSSGRAPPCQGGGSEFEPRRPLHYGAAKVAPIWPGSSVG